MKFDYEHKGQKLQKFRVYWLFKYFIISLKIKLIMNITAV